MGPWKKMLVHVACTGLFLSGIPGGIMPATAQEAAVAKNEKSEPPLLAKAAELPDSPGTVMAARANEPQQQGGIPQATQPAPSQAAPAQSTPPQQEQAPQKPVGTAAAESPDTSGIAASQPAGVAIAPAKQRRTRTIILKLGAVIGAGVAVGSVVALTAATNSKPPGAH